MTIRRPHPSHWQTQKSRRRQAETVRRRSTRRRPLLEALEARQLLAVGPQLAGIQPNQGDLLRDGQIRNIAPRELVFHFSDGAAIDPTTLDGIRLTRSGGDGRFEKAVATSDFNTQGRVIVDFTAVSPGESGNDIAIHVIKNQLGAGALPRLSVLGGAIHVELNTTAGSATTASQLVTAINAHPQVRQLVTASIRAGTVGSTDIATPRINYSPIVTSGANAASTVTNLSVGNTLQMKLIAKQAGPAGTGIQVIITRRDFGGVAPPRVTVNNKTISVEVNSNAAAPTTAGELVTAINSSAAASALVTAQLPVGDPNTTIGNRITTLQLELTGVGDIPIVPGFIGLGDTPRQVVMRFAQPLPDDLYRVEVLGSGPFALRNVNGGAFGDTTDDNVDNGVDFGLTFELDLGAQVLAVVPQPVTLNRQQFRDRINVYFNDDDLFPTRVATGERSPNPSVVDPAFYQLIFTHDTVRNTDDVVYRPRSVQYDPVADLATLIFDQPLDQLGSGPGTFRLRIGTDESLPLPPVRQVAGFATASTDFNTTGAVRVDFTAKADFASRVTVQVTKRNFNGPGGPVVSVLGQQVRIELNTNAGNQTTAQQLVNAVNAHAQASQLLTAAIGSGLGSTNIATPAGAVTNLTLAGLGSSFDTATNLGTLTDQSLIFTSAIEPQPFDLIFPGDEAEPGHRDLRPEVQRHFLADIPDQLAGIEVAFYNFQDEYGFDPLGNVLHNAITEAQKQRTREIFSLYSQYLGIQFIETANLGMTIVTGDLRGLPAATVPVPGPGGVLGAAVGGLTGTAIMDLQDFSNPGDDIFGGRWFLTAMHEIGHLLGIGHTDELPPPTIMNGQLVQPGTPTGHPLDFPENTVEPIFPSDHDIVHGQYLYRPDNKDIDMYRFQLPERGRLSAETLAERLAEPSLLDTVITLYRQNSDGSRELIARNDDYYSNDSYFELDLPAGTYWIGVSASGNDKYDPVIDDTGLGGRSQGSYELRVNFRPDADRTITDATGVALDGDADGVPGGVYNTWFRVQTPQRTIFVDKSATTAGNGTLFAPYQNLGVALTNARAGDVVRVLANGGADRNLATVEDNLAYEIGFNRLGTVLADGATLEIPRGVTLMVDAGAIIKLRRARIAVGSSTSGQTGGAVDRSAAALQILGTPILLDAFGNVVRDALGQPIPGSVYLTSIHDKGIGKDSNPDSFPPNAAAGDWGGIVFQRNIDAGDANRFDYEREGIFLNVVNQADLRFGGGNVVIDGLPQAIAPIHLTDARPTIAFNRISRSADAAMSASPNSFEETNFHAPSHQFIPFTADYQRIGPDVYGNTAVNNSINGLFVRVVTPAGSGTLPLTVSARWDDVDLPIVLANQLKILGTPGGPTLDVNSPTVQLVTLTPVDGGTLAAGTYNYRVVFVDANGNEGAPSSPTADVTLAAGSAQGSIQLDNLPVARAPFIARRIYRSDNTGDTSGPYVLVAEINVNSTSYLDRGGSLGRVLVGQPQGTLRARLDARLAIDPGVVVKLNGGGIEATFGADFYAEGVDGREIIFTSIYDDRFGGGGSFDTSNDGRQILAAPGDWGGLIGGHAATFSLDHVILAFGGGIVDIEGTFAGFNPIELHQASARVANSRLEFNGNGVSALPNSDRQGRGFNRPATIFVRGSQPVIVRNDIAHSAGAAISIDVNSLNWHSVRDFGRSTYNSAAGQLIKRNSVALDNQGPLVRLNRLENNAVNGMQVRGGTLTTEGVWDDTDIVHVLINEGIYVPDFHTYGGLRLKSSTTQSLVVKLSGAEAGFTATGRPLDIDDRIGGVLHIVGQPSHPVVLTSLADDTVGAGFQLNGDPQLDTGNDGAPIGGGGTPTLPTGPEVNNGTLIDNDVPVGTVGFFAVNVGNGGSAISSGVTVQGRTQSAVNADFIFDFRNFVDVGSNGQALDLAASTITMPATLIGPDLVASEGNFQGANGVVNWRMESRFDNGVARFVNTLTLTSASALGNLRFISYLDEDVFGISDDILVPVGTPGQPDFRAFTLDGPERFGFSQGGFYLPGPELVNATYDGWAADEFADLITAIGGAGTQYSIPGNIDRVSLPAFFDPDLGNVFGPEDITTAFAWSVDPAATSATITSFLELIPQDPATVVSLAGDWRSVALEQYSHDRNIEIIIEQEPAESAAPGINATPEKAQAIGSLAPHEKSGDENLRLGFQIQGSLTAPRDLDVYSFSAQPGTEVWFDIDRTSNSLDTVVELIDASGVVLARSDNSLAERADPSLLFRGPGVAANHVNPLAKRGYDPANPATNSALSIPDRYGTNPRDAGMRVVLPGQPGTARQYFVRVRSSSPNLDNLAGGLTYGNYQLQIRLRELDEVPGSTVRYSDIRFATNGIEVFGQPIHSPLLGEAAETERLNAQGAVVNNNSSLATAQEIGNLLQTDRGALAVSGNLQTANDVDFYRLEVTYDSIQPSAPNKHLAAIFDIDYADGFGRPNSVISIFDSDGRLILTSKGSNVADDRPRALQGTDTTDLTRGSAGTLDPFLGPVELPAGPQLNPDAAGNASQRGIYYVAISSNAQLPDELRQYLEPNPPNPFVRMEPVNSVRRIAEDRIAVTDTNTSVAAPPVIPVLIDPQTSIVPFKLGDVTLFVSQDVGLASGTASTLRYVDPFTGFVEATAGSFIEPIADIAMRGDGNLFAFTTGPDNRQGLFNDATIGTYVQIDTGTAASTKLQDDGVETYVQQATPANPGNAERAPLGANNNGVGMLWQAITFRTDTNQQFNNGFAVGSRPDAFDNDADQVAQAGTGTLENVLFHFDINTGVVANRVPTAQDRQQNAVLNGAGTQKIEYGEILTFTRIIPQNPEIGDTFRITINGRTISYTVAGTPIDIGNNVIVNLGTVEEVVAGLAGEWQTAALTIPEFAAFEVLNSGQFPGSFPNSVFMLADELRVRLVNPAYADVTINASTINGGFSAFESMFVEGFGPGGQVTGIDFVGNTMYAVTDRGGLYQVSLTGGGLGGGGGPGFFFSNNLATYVRSSAIDLMTGNNGQAIQFAGLTAGPANVENGKYANMLFGITTNGQLYAFDTTGQLQPIFVNNQTSVDTGLSSVNGLAFSTLDRNLWQITGNRGADEGHGFNGPQNTYEPFDHSRLDLGGSGGSSLYFGNERGTNTGGNQSFSNTAYVRDYNFAGGAHGTVISNPFSLEGYSPADLPVMYFNYFLGTEGTDYNPNTNPITPTRDTLRVFISDNNGEWTLLATNNTFQSATLQDEFDIGENDLPCTYPANASEPCVQKLFDNTGTWRQARIPLGRFAGRSNLRIRFDFSTAGEMNVGNTMTVGSELRTPSGAALRDGQTFTLSPTNTLEYDLGYTLVAPNGAAIRDGNSFTISPDGVRTITFEFDNDNNFRQDIAVPSGINFRDGERFTVTRNGQTVTLEFDSGSSLLVPAAGAAVIRDAETFLVNDVEFEFDDDGVFAGANPIISLVVDQALRVPLAGGGPGGLTDGESFSINDGIGGPDILFEFDNDGLVNAGARLVDTTNFEIQVPIAGAGFGGIRDGDSFSISDGFGGQPVIFEFDKNNIVAPGSRLIAVSDSSTQNDVANAIVGALLASGLGLTPVNQGGGVVRLGVVNHQVDTSGTPTIAQRRVAATANEIADRLVVIILNAGLSLTPINAGLGRVRLGSTTHVVTNLNAPNLNLELVRANQNELANLIVSAMNNAGLPLTPVNLGGGEVFLGQTTALDTSGTAALSQRGAPGLNQPNATAIPFSPTQSANQLAVAVTAAINSALGINATTNGNIVDLPLGTSFSPSGTALTPANVVAVAFGADLSAEKIAENIQNAISQAFLPVTIAGDLSGETNDRFATATDTGIRGGATRYTASGIIGDNLSFPFERGLDVDFARMVLAAGDQVSITATRPLGSPLQPALQLYNAQGQLLRSATSAFTFNPITGMLTGGTPQIDFTAIAGGVYYVAVSSSQNLRYNPNFDGSADVTLNVPTQGGAIGGLTDGESFSIARGNAPPVVFEFDSNGVVAPGAIRISLNDILLQIPSAAAGVGGIQDRNTFIINDNAGSGNVVFEFDTDWRSPTNPVPGTPVVSPGAIPILIDPFFDTAASIAAKVATAITNANLGLTPQIRGGSSVQLFTTNHTVSSGGTPTMQQLTTPRTQQQITTLLRDAIRTAGLGLAPTQASTTVTTPFGTFTTFGGGLTLDVRDHVVDTTLAPNLTKVIPTNTGQYQLEINVIADPFGSYRSAHRVNVPTAVTVTQSGLPTTFIEGQPGVLGNRTAVKVHAGMTDAQVAQATAAAIGLSVANYDEQIVAVSGAQITDGEIFSLSDGNVTVNFEFESGFRLLTPDLAVNPTAYLDGEFFTITRNGTAINFEFDNNGSVSSGAVGLRFNDLVIAIPAGGMTEDINGNGTLDFIFEDTNGNGVLDPGEDLNGNGILDFLNEDRNFNGLLDLGIVDGNTFRINRGPGTPTTVFEFDTNGISAFGNQVISVTPTANEVEVANATVQALNRAGLGLNARVIGRGQPTGGPFGGASVLIQLGISNHNVDLTLTPTITQSTVLRGQDEMGALIAQAVAGAGLSLAPTYLGNGVVHIGGDSSHRIDISNAVTLSSTGLPGPSDPTAIVIPVFPSDTVSPADVSQLLISAINTARANRGLQITAVANGARRVNLNGNTVISDFSQAPSLPIHRAGDTVTWYENIVNVVGHTITNPGPLGVERSLAGDFFGAFETSGPPNATNYPGALRGMDNAHEGVYIDDIIIGFAERGEMVTGTVPNSAFVNNAELLNPQLPVGFVPHGEVHVGEYTLEVRRASEFGLTLQDPSPELLLQRAFDTNDRLTGAVSLTAPPGHRIIEGQTFTLSDGLNSLVFEFDDLAINNGVAANRIRIPYRVSDTAPEIGRRIRDAVNSPQVQAVLRITAAMSDGVAVGTQISPAAPASSSNKVNFFGNAVITVSQTASRRTVNATEANDTIPLAIASGIGTQDVSEFVATGSIGDNPNLANLTSDVDMFSMVLTAGQVVNLEIQASRVGSTLDSVLTVYDSLGQFVAFNDDFNGLDSFIQFTAPAAGTYFVAVSGFANFFPNPFIPGSGGATTYSTGGYTLRITTDALGFSVTEYTDLGDSNIVRDQGQLLIHSNRISNAAEYGILADAGTRDGNGQRPHPGPVRTTREVNQAQLVTGVVIMNNVISNNGTGGIRFSGTPTAANEQPGAIPFGRILNNTIYGGGRGVGIQIDENVSPTVLNNIVANLQTGINVDLNTFNPLPANVPPVVLGGTVYQGNTNNTLGGIGLGASAMVMTAAEPLFTNPSASNFYLARGSRAIDSSINSLQDRPEILSVKSPLGFSPSPILAPDMDALGQTRIDDPTVASPPGQGANVFKDRGAIDRADFAGPTAMLITPRDNDALGLDGDARMTFVTLTNQIVTDFSIQLLDGVEPDDPQDGTGADDSSVRGDRVSVFRDGVKLQEGVDYKFAYDATNNVIRLTPLAGIWEVDRKYEIELSNSRGLLLTAPDGSQVTDGGRFDLTDNFGNTVHFEFDSGYVMQVPQTLAIQIPAAGGAALVDRNSFTVSNTATGVTLTFEFDLDGFTTPGTIPIRFSPTDSANDIANAMVAAIQGAQAQHGLSPVNIVNFGGRAVHLGTRSIHAVNITNTPFTTTGQLAGIDEGQTFRIDNGQNNVLFEFSTTGGSSAGARVIPFTFSQTNEQIAQSIVNAIVAANLGLNPTYVALSDGLINIGGEPRHLLDAANSRLVVTGQPGATPEWSLKIPTAAGRLDLTRIRDGEQFIISNGTRSLLVELDNNGILNPPLPNSPPRTVVTYNDGTTVDQFVNALAVAIRQGNVGLSPSNAGFGVLSLSGTLQHSVNLTNSSFTQLGAPGVPATIAVPFKAGSFFQAGVPSRTPIFSAEQMAQAIAAAINQANAAGRLRQVSAVARGVEVNVEGVVSVGGLATSIRADIVDLAGNPLKPNRADGTTRFTIGIGSGLDYGDAPAPYPTTLAQNGARHQVTGGFFLGTSVDVDFDGLPSLLADGDDLDNLDDEDGVVVTTPLQGGSNGTLTVTASAAGFLDAWIDFNQNGVWEESERIFNRQALAPGANLLTVNVPGTALPGNTFGRFRFSSAGGLQPTGPAADGEVEDHRLTILGNPWHNAPNRWDTNANGFVVPLDALLVINFLNLNPLNLPTTGPNAGKLPPTRPADQPYVDVNGDGFATAIDVLQVINRLENPGAAAEGEAPLSQAALPPALPAAGQAFSNSLPGATQIVVDHRLTEVYDQQEVTVLPALLGRAEDAATWSALAAPESLESLVDRASGDDDVDEELLDLFASDSSPHSIHDEIFGGDWL